MSLHQSDDERISTEQPVLTAKIASKKDVLMGNRQHVDTDADNLVQSQPKPLKLLDLGRVISEPSANPGIGPAERLTRLQRHQPMGNVAQQCRRHIPLNVARFDSFEEPDTAIATARVHNP